MTAIKREEIIGDCRLILGDSLGVMSEMGDGTFDSILSDPPFSSGARTDAGKSVRGAMTRGAEWDKNWFSHDNMATHGFLFLMRLIGVECLRICKDGANAHFFIDWRMYPNLYGALESCGWIVKNLVVWDKLHFGMGTNYRNQHELIIYAEKGKSKFPDHGTGNVLSEKRIRPDNHPTEKPVWLLSKIMEASTDRDSLILDPFMGSGSTGVACLETGRRFVGIEINENHFNTACKRIDQATRQGKLFQPPKQQPKPQGLF